MTDGELGNLVMAHMAGRGRGEIAIAYGIAQAVRDKVRLETARACAEECTNLAVGMYPHASPPYKDCASAIRARFGVEPATDSAESKT